MVIISHRVDGTIGPNGKPITPYSDAFETYYAHLGKVFVKWGQEVRRGDLIGSPDHLGYPKLLLKIYNNWENPDNWGPNHSRMVDRDEFTQTEKNTVSMKQKYENQYQIIKNLYTAIGVSEYDWSIRSHNKNRRWDAIARWSLVEHMRYLECLYETEPEKFTGLSSDNFYLKRDEFYKNQSLVLTIPF
jgi:hypothetical protein